MLAIKEQSATPMNGTVLAHAGVLRGAEQGFPVRAMVPDFLGETNLPAATNAIATAWRTLKHATQPHAVDIPLTDPLFWTLPGSVGVAQLCREHGLTWGSRPDNYFDVLPAMFTLVAAAAPGGIAAIDMYWIWQHRQRHAKEPPKTEGDRVKVRNGPGLAQSSIWIPSDRRKP